MSAAGLNPTKCLYFMELSPASSPAGAPLVERGELSGTRWPDDREHTTAAEHRSGELGHLVEGDGLDPGELIPDREHLVEEQQSDAEA